MPLSEHEQRVLRQIERQFDQGRGPLRSLGRPTDARHAVRNVRRSIAGLALGLLALSLSFASSWVIGLIGFVIMLASAMTLVQSLRWLGRERWRQLLMEQGAKGGPGGRAFWRGRPGRGGNGTGQP